MSPIALMILFLLMMDCAKAEGRPVVILDPNWNKFFTTDSLSLTCSTQTADSNNRIYSWYKDGQRLQVTKKIVPVTYPKVTYSGNYQCRLSGGPISDPVRVDIFYDWLILQAPPYVYEGDALTLRCRGWDSSFERKTLFFRDNVPLSTKESLYSTEIINRSDAGKYKCERRRETLLRYVTEVAETFIRVNELFSEPTMKLVQSGVMEGDVMTVRCDTTLAPPRRDLTLQFAFYKNGQTLRGFGASDTFQVQSAVLEDSGNYLCEVKTASDTVKKKSKVLIIQIEELFPSPEIVVNPLGAIREEARVTMRCNMPFAINQLYFMFYKDSQMIQDTSSNVYVIRHAREEHIGRYKCSARSMNGKVSKNSSSVDVQINTAVGQTQLKAISTEVAIGDEIVLSCESTKGSPPIHYRLYHNETIVRNVTVTQKKAAEVHIKVDSLNKAGNYSCDSDNSYSPQKKLSNTVRLFVIDPVSDMNIDTNKEDGDVWPLILILLLCLVPLCVLLIVYRDWIVSIFPRCHQQPDTGSTFAKVKVRAGPPPTSDVTQNVLESAGEDYANVLSVTRPAAEDVCYSHIQISKGRGSMDTARGTDEYAVTYSAVKSSGT